MSRWFQHGSKDSWSGYVELLNGRDNHYIYHPAWPVLGNHDSYLSNPISYYVDAQYWQEVADPNAPMVDEGL